MRRDGGRVMVIREREREREGHVQRVMPWDVHSSSWFRVPQGAGTGTGTGRVMGSGVL